MSQILSAVDGKRCNKGPSAALNVNVKQVTPGATISHSHGRNVLCLIVDLEETKSCVFNWVLIVFRSFSLRSVVQTVSPGSSSHLFLLSYFSAREAKTILRDRFETCWISRTLKNNVCLPAPATLIPRHDCTVLVNGARWMTFEVWTSLLRLPLREKRCTLNQGTYCSVVIWVNLRLEQSISQLISSISAPLLDWIYTWRQSIHLGSRQFVCFWSCELPLPLSFG